MESLFSHVEDSSLPEVILFDQVPADSFEVALAEYRFRLEQGDTPEEAMHIATLPYKPPCEEVSYLEDQS